MVFLLLLTMPCYFFLNSAVSKLNYQIASWDTKFETGTKTALMQPFSPIVIAADENERIRYFICCLIMLQNFLVKCTVELQIYIL